MKKLFVLFVFSLLFMFGCASYVQNQSQSWKNKDWQVSLRKGTVNSFTNSESSKVIDVVNI